MGFRTLAACVEALRREGSAVVCDEPVDPHLEIAEIQRRLYRAGGPAVLFSRPRGCGFPVLVNLFGTRARVERIFADTMDRVRRLVELKIDPSAAAAKPWRYWRAPLDALTMLPRRVRRGPSRALPIPLSALPQVVSWPGDGGPFMTLPCVYTEEPGVPGTRRSNLGMYRVQLAGNDYARDGEVGLHYQIHRGIGVHHARALERGEPLRVVITAGGTPAFTVAAMMPLPEGLSELTFAGALAGHRIPMIALPGRPAVYAEADFVIEGTILPHGKPEGPFGDHLGYYARRHDFPCLRVERVSHRPGAIWPMTVVGRPPQEDTMFGWLVHELTGPVIPTVLPGVRSVHAVDAAGVHPLLLAVGSERYRPWRPAERPAELLTQASSILGQGQLSLAKYLLIVDGGAVPGLDAHDIAEFLGRLLERVDWRRDCHFHTQTTIDTLDYSGSGFNQGSKLVVAAGGPPSRTCGRSLPDHLPLPAGFDRPRLCLPGVIAVRGPKIEPRPRLDQTGDAAIWGRVAAASWEADMERLCAALATGEGLDAWPLIVVCDDPDFAAASLDNFLWTTFTRSNPAADVHGVGAATRQKHWGCTGALVIDARIKPHHAPALEEDPAVSARVDRLAASGGALAGLLG